MAILPWAGAHSHRDLRIHCSWKVSSDGVSLPRLSPSQSQDIQNPERHPFSLLVFTYCHLVASLAFFSDVSHKGATASTVAERFHGVPETQDVFLFGPILLAEYPLIYPLRVSPSP